MSKVDDLIAKLCPNGVEYKAIGEIGTLVRGNGMPKSDFEETGVGCIHYGQIYTYYGIWTAETISFIAKEKADKLAKVDPGDIIITNTSENIDDVCKAVAWLGDCQIVTGGHATVLKHDQDSKYISYYLKTPTFFTEKKRYATGTKVIDVSAKNLGKIKIPVPPLEIQREIVKVLDTFTKLEAELEAELEARRRQYHYYRDQLLNFEGRDDVQWVTLGEVIVNLRTGLNPRQNFVLNPPDAKNYYITVRELGGLHIVLSDKTDKINDDALKIINNRSKLRTGDVLFSGTGTIGNTALIECAPSNWNIKEGVYALTPNIKKIISKFLLYILKTTYVLSQINNYSAGSTVVSISMANFKRVIIPVPSLEEQARIVATLDKFDALVNDLSSGLPAEIAARRKQYEYYRDRLLTFKEAQ
ncbi:restriction endonuclease subunit S [uncultured Bilophila sp.]|uniref:restriction endonuclease subunit S n=1 Tax=uncultured Bilophila sp. TaxID=529385 RepID=UPI00266EAFE2|nr:restriction endonuclease subunit S [uncultured Bilophila sp.]